MAKHFRTKEQLLARTASRQAMGPLHVTHSFDLSNAATPDRVYIGKECAVEYKHELVEIVFAQLKRGTKELRSMVVITMPPLHVVTMLNAIKRMNSPGLLEIVRELDLKSEPLGTLETEAEQTAEMTAQIARVSIAGQETEIDFYKMSPQAVAKHKYKADQIQLEPQVRIEIRTTLFLGLVEALEQLSSKFPTHALLTD